MPLSFGAGSHEIVEATKRHSRSLDLEQTNARHVRLLHQRSASESDGLVLENDNTIEKQVPSKVFSLYKKLSTPSRYRSGKTTGSFLPEIKTTDRFKKSRASFSSALSTFLPNNTKHNQSKQKKREREKECVDNLYFVLIAETTLSTYRQTEYDKTNPTYLLAQTGESRYGCNPNGPLFVCLFMYIFVEGHYLAHYKMTSTSLLSMDTLKNTLPHTKEGFLGERYLLMKCCSGQRIRLDNLCFCQTRISVKMHSSVSELYRF